MWPCRRGHRGHNAALVLWWPWVHHLPLPFSLNEETFYGPDCLCPQKVTPGWWERQDTHDGEAGLSPHISFPPQKPRLDSDVTSPGVDIQVTVTKGHPPRTFRQAAVLVVAVTKLQKQPVHKDFADSDLGGFLEDIFGMGWWWWRCHSSWGMLLGDVLGPGTISISLTISLPAEPISFQQIEDTYARAPVYRYTRSQSFDILDIDHKCFVLESPTQLVALHLQGPSARWKGEGTRSLSSVPVPNPGSKREPPHSPGTTH